MNKTILATTVASLLTHSSLLLAQEQQADETMVVTANRFEQSIKSTLAPISVIEKDDIQKLQAQSAFDVLKTLPGVEINSLGSKASETGIYIRGTSSKHALVLIDGVRINSATLGGASIGLIPASVIERIEVVRGPRAAVYGSDAIGGVISIQTVPSDGKVHELSLGKGSNGFDQQSWRSVGDISANTRGSFFYNNENSNGHRVYGGAPKGDTHGYNAEVIFGNLIHQIDDVWTISFSGFHQDSSSEHASRSLDGPKQLTDTDRYSLTGGVNYHQDKLSSSLQLSETKDHNATGDADRAKALGEITSRRKSLSWVNTYRFSEVVVFNAGLDYYKEYATRGGANQATYEKGTKDNKAAFVTAAFYLDELTAEFSLRHDRDSAFGSNTTWNGAAGYFLNDELELFASIGTAFKAPTFNDLYWPADAWTEGNPNLKPESSQSKEIGLRGYYNLFDWSVIAYDSSIENMIDWAPNSSGKYTPSNVEDATIKGIELEVSFSTGPISHRVVGDWKNPIDKKDDSVLLRRAKQSFKWVTSYSHESVDVALSANHVGERFDEGNEVLAAYTSIDVGIGYQVTPQFSAKLRLENATDKEYVTGKSSTGYYYYPAGRSYFLNLAYQF